MMNSKQRLLMAGAAFLLLALSTACGSLLDTSEDGAISTTHDGGALKTDSGTSNAGLDASQATKDAAGLEADSGSLKPDAAVAETDSGTPATDSGLPATDSGVPATDSGVPPDSGTPVAPTVLANTPLDLAFGVSVNANASVIFSEAMDSTTITTSTFTLATGSPAVNVQGSVSYANATAYFWPAAQLASNTTFNAAVTSGILSASGLALATEHSWSFTTGSVIAPELPVDLGTSGNFVILAKTGISTVPNSAITGDIAVSPAAASFITGFSLTADSTNVFSTSPQVTGEVFAADYTPPTPSNLTTAVSDMLLAFTDAAGRAPGVTELGAGNIGGMTLPAGVYKWGTGVLIPSDVTLTGSKTDVWIFQIGQDLSLSSGVKVLLAGGALPKNIFWQVAGLVDFGTTAHCEGVVLTQTSVTLRTGASINGRLLAQTAVNIDKSTVVEPAL
jgi:hypothetical protein